MAGRIARENSNNRRAVRSKLVQVSSYLRLKVQSTKYKVRSAKYKEQRAKYKVQSTKCKVQSAKCEVQSAKYKVQRAKYKVRSTKYFTKCDCSVIFRSKLLIVRGFELFRCVVGVSNLHDTMICS